VTLGLVVFSNIILFIYDVIFNCISSSWLYNYYYVLGLGHIQPSTYIHTYIQQCCNLPFTKTVSLPAALRAVCVLVKTIHMHMYVHRQGSLIGIRKTQYDLHKTQAILM